MTRPIKFFLELTGFAVGFLFIATAFLLWRATNGPVRLDFLRPVIERELARHAETSIAFEHISLGSEHWNAPVLLRLEGISIPPDRLGFPVTIGSVGVSFSFHDMLQGKFRLVGLVIERPVIRLSQADLEPTGGRPDGQQFSLDSLISPKPKSFLAEWQDLAVRNGELSLADGDGHPLAVLHGLQARLGRTSSGTDFTLSGLGGGTGEQSAVMGSAHYGPDLHGTAHVATGPIVLGLLSVISPDLKSLAMAEVPASLVLDADLQGETPLHAAVTLTIGTGQVNDPAIFPQPLPISGGSLKAHYDGTAQLLTIEEATVGLDAPTLSVTGTVRFQDGIRADADIGLKHMPIDAFSRYWPIDASPGGRLWVTQNISHGMVDDEMLHVTAGFGAAANDPVKVDGHIAVSDATVHYFGKLPDVTGVNADIAFDADHMNVHLLSGNAAGLKVTDGTVVLDGFQAEQQAIAIDLALDGPVSSALAIIDAPPLGYAKKLGMKPKEVAGTGSTKFHMNFPLLSSLNVEDTNLHTVSTLADVTLPHVVKTFDLTALNGTLTVGLAGLDLTGTGKLANIPLQIAWKQAFDAHASPSSDGTFEGTLDDTQRVTLGIDAPDRLTGPVPARMRYLDYGRTSTLAVEANLEPAQFTIGEIAYVKPKGAPGSAHATVQLENGKITRITDIGVKARDFAAEGQALLRPDDGSLDRLSISSLHTGLTEVTIDFQPHQDPPALSVVGPEFDARPLLHQKPDPDAEQKPAATGDIAPLSLTLDIGEIKASDTPGINHVKGSLLLHGRHWKQASFTGDTAGKPISIFYQPDDGPNPGYNFTTDVADLGDMLRAVDATDTIHGGTLHIEGRKPPAADDDLHPALEGTATIGQFTVKNPPVFARLFSALTVNGFLNSLSGAGIVFDSVSGRFSVTHETVAIEDGKAAGAGIGLTLQGTANRDDNTLNLHGTVIPAYGINTFVNHIPVLGEFLTGGDGEGVFSTTYSITGPAADPNVFVNPIALFLPGPLRSLFFELPYKIGDDRVDP